MFTACLNRVCRVRSTIRQIFIKVLIKSFSHQPAIYKQCCQVLKSLTFLYEAIYQNLGFPIGVNRYFTRLML